MMTRFVFLCSLLAIVVSGSVSAQDEEEDEATGEDKRVCVNTRIIDSFDALDDRNLYVKARGNDHYLFKISGTCFGLRNAKGIAIKDSTSRVCSDGFGEIIFRDMGRAQSCRIGTIEKVENKDDARARVN